MDCSGWIPGMIHLDFLISPIGPQESEESSWHMFFLLYFFWPAEANPRIGRPLARFSWT
jgi:hypothetical protein